MYKDLIKEFLLFLLLLTIVLGSLMLFFYFSEVDEAQKAYETNETIHVKIGKQAITNDIESIVTDLLVLAQHSVFRNSAEPLDLAAVNLLAQDFLIFSENKRLYDQVRFFDQKGMEIVRVNFNAGQPAIVPNHLLQNKGQRYYFTETIRLDKGQLFVSPFDLNIEQGKVEKPFKPMLRFGTPVFDAQGKKIGIIVLNYFGSKLLDHFDRATAHFADHVMLLNADGFWLHNPQHSEWEWGFMLEHKQSFGKQFPRAWKKIAKMETGQFYDEDRLFTFNTVYPLLEVRNLNIGIAKAHESRRSEITAMNYYWKIVALLPMQTRQAVANKIAWNLFKITGSIFILLALVTWLIVYIRFQRLNAENGQALLKQRIDTNAELKKANAELARTVRLKDEFLASMSHELRTPLNTILMMSELLRDGVYAPLNDKQKKAQGYIENSGSHLLSLINDILDLSKIEAGEMKLEKTPIKVAELCKTSMQFVKEIAAKKRVKMHYTVDDMVNILEADKRRLKQILINLLTNAVKFTLEGGEVELKVVGDEIHEKLHFIVSDTGIGISEEMTEHLFKPFVQIDNELSRQQEGTGLGLAFVYKMTEMHDGSVSLESKVGEGSTFTVSLPWKKTQKIPETTPHAMEKPVIAHHSSALLLLVEDQENNRIAMQIGLQAYYEQVIVASDGKEAIELARERNPALILMDIQMPVMDGLEATRRIRADQELANIPIIALTALAMPGDEERCLDAGANSYYSKPVIIKRLVKEIEKQLS
jgi:signal transduction histidine kinase